MIWSMVWWIHEVLIRSIFTWGQCFVAGSTGCAELGVVQGHVNELLLQEPRQVLCTTWRKAQNGPHVERLKLEFQFLLPVSEKCVKYGEPKRSRRFLVQKPKPAWEKHSDVGWPLLIPSGFGQFENGDVFTSQTDPSEGSKHGLCCVRGGSTHSLLHTAENSWVFLDEAQGGIHFLQKSIMGVVGQESFYAHTHPLKILSPVFPCFPFCH